MIEAAEQFNKGNTEKALQIYTKIIEEEQSEYRSHALLNRASAFSSILKYGDALKDCSLYLKQNEKASPQIYVVYLHSLIKLQRYEQASKLGNEVIQQFPYHKKIKDLVKLNKQKIIANDEELYIDAMFEKLCMHPKVRVYMKEQSFLTKVQKMIRNPSLTNTLAKMDPRIQEASEVLLMAEQDQI